jgi:hypothetical protein
MCGDVPIRSVEAGLLYSDVKGRDELTGQYLPFDLPSSWLLDPHVRSVSADANNRRQNGRRAAPVPASWLNDLVFNPLEDDFGEARDRILGIRNGLASDAGMGAGRELGAYGGTRRSASQAGIRCPW